jgi:hypothetical protein
MKPLKLVAGGFTPELFERYIHARFGTGDPVYWYAIGDSTTFPAGKQFMRTEGYDTGRLLAFDRDACTATGLTRKLIVLRDPTTSEIITGPDGQPAWINNFTYQLFTMHLENDFLVYEAEQGAGELLNTATGGLNRSEVQQFDGMTVFTTPVNYTMPVTEDGSQWEPVWETYDFIERHDNNAVQYDGLWSGAFPLPAAMGGGRSSMHAYFHRYDRYADLPESIRSFVEEYATMWREPPCDLDEIRELQK